MPPFENYEFDRGDHVEVDWRDGQGPLDTVVGTVTDISDSGVVTIVDVDAFQRHLSSTAAGANWSGYDFTGDNRTDVGDVQWL
jgi:hypothetical protein